MCKYREYRKPRAFGKSAYLPASLWGACKEEGGYICALSGDYCEAEAEPESCVLQEGSGILCPYCLEYGEKSLVSKNALGICHCSLGCIVREADLARKDN